MLIAVLLFLAIVSVPLAGGRLSRLADLQIRLGAWALGALALQVLIISVLPAGSHDLHVAIHIASYAIVAVVLAANIRLPHVWLLAVGGAMNLLAIAANGGVMPASAAALQAAGRVPAPGQFVNSAVHDHPHISFLGDVFAVPAQVPLANVFSVGDVCLVAGAFLFLHAAGASALAWRTTSRLGVA